MAAESKTRFDKQSTLSFTLPISCQICLGKVKQPVLCPNNHVFCGNCMEVWLSRNQQCPSCRVDINPNNPIQQIRGGLNHFEDENERLSSNPQMRKARFDLLYKEYEDEFERLTGEILILKSENESLRNQIKKENGLNRNTGEFTHPSTVDSSQILALTRKLQDSQKQFDRQKQELNRHKQENNELKDENVNLNRENERLRLEIVSRSPHRYGRYTVATLEAKVDSYEKEIKQLNKALERSDKYIEDLQKNLESHGIHEQSDKPKAPKDYLDFNSSVSDTKSEVDASKRRLFSGNGEYSQKSAFDKTDPVQFALDLYRNSTKSISSENDLTTSSEVLKNKSYGIPLSPGYKKWKSNLSGNSPQKDRTPKKVQFDLHKDNDTSASSFDLERPSPLTPSTYMEKLSLSDKKSSGKSASGNPSSAKKHLNFGEVQHQGSSKGSSSSRNLEIGDKLNQENLDDTGTIKSELDELNISMTPELSDCMKLMNRAEKNVYVSKSSDQGTSSGSSNFIPPVGLLVSGMTFNTVMNEYPNNSYSSTSVNHVHGNSISQSSSNHPLNQYGQSSSNPPTNYASSNPYDQSKHTLSTNKPSVSKTHTSSSSLHAYYPTAPIVSKSSMHFDQQNHNGGNLYGGSSAHHNPTSNPSIISQSSMPSYQSMHKDVEVGQKFASLNLTDMVKRGQNILKTLDLTPPQVQSQFSKAASNNPVYTQSQPSYTTSVSQFEPVLSTGVEQKSSYDSLPSRHNKSSGYDGHISSQNPKVLSLQNFDIPQSLIIPSPNLSAEFAAEGKASSKAKAEQRSVDFGGSRVRTKPPEAETFNSKSKSSSNPVLPDYLSKPPPSLSLYSSASIPSSNLSSQYLSFTGITSSASFPSKSFHPGSHASTLNQQQHHHLPKSSQNHINSSSQQPTRCDSTKSTTQDVISTNKQLIMGDNSTNSLDFSCTGNSDSFQLEAPVGNYSYVSNDLSRGSDSFLPEPKKRLFETDDSLDMSPIKTSRHF